ncbi:aquaporin-like protein [Xylariaceae sp. FL0016]|nr:aquaporin-like protein [Xylariaceae sp. FL0016]
MSDRSEQPVRQPVGFERQGWVDEEYYDHTPWDVDFRYKADGEPVGQREDDEAEQGGWNPDDLRNWWARFRAKYPEPLADCWAWGFAFMLGIYIGGGVSSAHMNPAISILSLHLPRLPLPPFLASIIAGALAYGIYYDAIHCVDPSLESSYTCFFSCPQNWVSNVGTFISQFVAGSVMMIAVFALDDDQNNPPGAGTHAFILGLLQASLKFSLGYNTGSALNPASDFGPRLVALWVGYRTPKIFTNAWWVYGPWAAALAGSIAGCVFYDLFIFVGSESPGNYRIPKAFRRRANQLKDLTRKF